MEPDDTKKVTEPEQTEDESDFDAAFIERAEEAGSGKKFEFVEKEPETDEESKAKEEEEAAATAKAEEKAKIKEAEETKAAEEKAKAEGETEEETKARKEKEAEAKEGKKAEEEEDEVEKRGKELLEAEEKAKKEQEEAKAKEVEETKAAETKAAKPVPVSKDLATALSSLLTEGEVSESVEVDGIEVDLKQYFEDFPEAKIASALMAKKVIERLVERDVLMSRTGYEDDMAGVVDLVQDVFFELKVSQLMPDYEEVIGSKEFEGLAGGASPAIKALLASSSPKDFVDAVKKLTGKDKLPKKEKGETEAQKIAREKKERHDRLYKSSGKSSSGPGGDINPTADEEDYSAAFDEALEKR